MKSLVVRVLALAVGGLLLFTGWSLFSSFQQPDALKDAVVLTTATVDPQNEGKLVLFHGTVAMESPACDSEYGLTFSSPAVLRNIQAYRRDSNSSSNRKWNWKSMGSRKLVGEASIGEFSLDKAVLAQLPIDTPCTVFRPEEIAELYLYENIGGTTYLSKDSVPTGSTRTRSIGEAYVGKERVSYRCFDGEKTPEITVIGLQKGTSLTICQDISGASVFSGALTVDQVQRAHQKSALLRAGIGFLFACICLVVLARLTKDILPRKKNKPANPSLS